jgi:hypothetical protein
MAARTETTRRTATFPLLILAEGRAEPAPARLDFFAALFRCFERFDCPIKINSFALDAELNEKLWPADFFTNESERQGVRHS